MLPCAIEKRVAIALGPGSGRMYSDDFHQMQNVDDERNHSWADYPRGVLWALRERGSALPPWDAAFAGDVPLGAGLSSSAAIEAATALALRDWAKLELSRPDLARLCQAAENGYVGVQSGIMDQYASLLCRAGQALLLDCRTLHTEQIPLDLAGAGLVLLVCDTRVERGLEGTAYNERRTTCERAAAHLGVESLRDVTPELLSRLSGLELRRARHVVMENERVLAAAEALRHDNFDELGQLMLASHLSLRDDYEVSVEQLDTAVDAAMSHGALGARLTGAGFGGCTIALVRQEELSVVRESIMRSFARRSYTEPHFYAFEPAAGAETVS